jgi:hypothetical protein
MFAEFALVEVRFIRAESYNLVFRFRGHGRVFLTTEWNGSIVRIVTQSTPGQSLRPFIRNAPTKALYILALSR